MMCIFFRFVNLELLKEEYIGIVLRGLIYKKVLIYFNNE